MLRFLAQNSIAAQPQGVVGIVIVSVVIIAALLVVLIVGDTKTRAL